MIVAWIAPLLEDAELVDWDELLAHLGHMLVAFLLALPTGWNRETREHSAGLRTFPLVALASCAFVRMALSMFPEGSDAMSRVLEGLITGIGFIGGGAILKNDDRVKGTATATSLWCTGALGAAVAVGRYEIGLLISLLNFLTLAWMSRFKRNVELERERGMEGDEDRSGS